MRSRLRAVLTLCLLVVEAGAAAATPNIRLTADPGSSIRPRLALDPSNNAIVVWQDDRFGNNEILWQKFDQIGNPLTSVIRVTNTAASSVRPDIACDAAGTSHIVWQEGESINGVGTVYLCRLDASGTKTFGDLLIKDFSGDARVTCPSTGASDLFWAHYAPADQDVYYRRYNSSGTQTCQRQFNAGTIPGISKTPAICGATNGDAQLFWIDMTTSFQLHLRQGATLNSCASGQAVAWNGNAHSPSTDNSGTNNIYAVFEAGGDIYNFLGAPSACKLSQGSGSSSQPAVAADPNQGYAVWRDTRDGNTEIYFSRYAGCPSTTGDVRLSADAAVSETPDITVEKSGSSRWVAVWSDGRDGNREIYLTSQALADAPMPPGNLTATLLCPPAASLTWQDLATNETSYEVQTAQDGGAWVAAATLAANATAWTSGPLQYGHSYAYQVRACNGGPCSNWAGPVTLTVAEPPPGTLAGQVQGYVVARPYESATSLRGIVVSRAGLLRVGVQQLPGAFTNAPNGMFSLNASVRCNDQVFSQLDNAYQQVIRATQSPPTGCSSECLTVSQPSSGSTSIVWQESDAVNAWYLAERFSREFWQAGLGVTPQMLYQIRVGDPSPEVARSGGGTTGTGTTSGLPITSFQPGLVQYADAVYHEFGHRMVIERVGELLCRGNGGFPEARGMDEGLADFFAAAYTHNSTFGSGIPTIPPRELDQIQPAVYSVCDGSYHADGYYGARVFGGALWDTRKAFLAAGADEYAVAKWIYDALGEMRGLNPGDRTFLLFRTFLLTQPPFNQEPYAQMVRDAFDRHNITESPAAICVPRPTITSASRTVGTSGQTFVLGWTPVPHASFHRLYVRTTTTTAGLAVGTLIADHLTENSYTYTNADTTLLVAFLVAAVDATGGEGPASDELPAVTGVPTPEMHEPVSNIFVEPNPSSSTVRIRFSAALTGEGTVKVYDIAGRFVRELWAGHLVGGEPRSAIWDGRDTSGRRGDPGVYMIRLTGPGDTRRAKLVLMR